ncbi:TetR/AcrR family transcriptional regulator [Mesoterricola silvestris]|uniref:TetR family transcriptional regulator n=1 Tax=Mesoterricola silvestris TaxID=2927979 RepID=A0AA48GKE7_9BACT|nr:TetR/AcrR family transcriptional regulator [Mesoterricola silvestris]BDU71384.1 TetR family transcriptional regulator [Mesoterricola silvestris]
MTQHDPETSSRTRLIEAAILCFAEKGFDATGIREIAQRAKANSALVQYHFGGKTGLYAEALRHIFRSRPEMAPPMPAGTGGPEDRRLAMATLGEIVEGLMDELLACADGTELDRASLLLVTRELQSPRQDVADLILEHLRPTMDRLLACIRVLRPDLETLQAHEYMNSILAQVVHLHNNLKLVRLIRKEPDYPQDFKAVARHITEFSLRGLAVPEAFPGA